jgi:hypothetical protein
MSRRAAAARMNFSAASPPAEWTRLSWQEHHREFRMSESDGGNSAGPARRQSADGRARRRGRSWARRSSFLRFIDDITNGCVIVGEY